MATADAVLGELAKLAGENEAAVGSNNTTVNQYFGVRGAAYCGYALLYAMTKAGCRLLEGAGAWNVGNLARFCEARGWRVSEPERGDIFVQRTGSTENGHTGFVWEGLGGGRFITLEGNYGAVKATAAQAKNGTGTAYEGIGYRLASGSGYKFYRPAYDGAGPAHPNRVGPAADVRLNLCQTGHEGPMVKTIQRILYSYGLKGADGKPITADGQFGANTAWAVKALQARLGLAADGQVGPDTWTAMLTNLW